MSKKENCGTYDHAYDYIDGSCSCTCRRILQACFFRVRTCKSLGGNGEGQDLKLHVKTME